jgi:hypothetical protein
MFDATKTTYLRFIKFNQRCEYIQLIVKLTRNKSRAGTPSEMSLSRTYKKAILSNEICNWSNLLGAFRENPTTGRTLQKSIFRYIDIGHGWNLSMKNWINQNWRSDVVNCSNLLLQSSYSHLINWWIQNVWNKSQSIIEYLPVGLAQKLSQFLWIIINLKFSVGNETQDSFDLSAPTARIFSFMTEGRSRSKC